VKLNTEKFVFTLFACVLGADNTSTREEITGSWRKLHNEELYNWYSAK
jgi:hypothetical protein